MKRNKIKISLDYSVEPGTQINLVIVAPHEEREDDDGPRIGFHAGGMEFQEIQEDDEEDGEGGDEIPLDDEGEEDDA
jgi:hypothetical protein